MLLITGANGQVGRAAACICAGKGIPFKAVGSTELDISNADSVAQVLHNRLFDCILNCAAYTAVDAAEDDRKRAFAVNAEGPALLAASGIPILHISTDYVFDGASDIPWETDSPTHPLSVYGASKLAGEEALVKAGGKGAVVRTAWVYSKRPGTKNFYQTIKRLASERSELKVVNDQIGTPTKAEDLADAMLTLYAKGAHRQPMQVLHFTNKGSCSWFDFACEIVAASGSNCNVLPILSSAYPAKAVRPKFSVLSLKSLEPWGIHPRDWREALLVD